MHDGTKPCTHDLHGKRSFHKPIHIITTAERSNNRVIFDIREIIFKEVQGRAVTRYGGRGKLDGHCVRVGLVVHVGDCKAAERLWRLHWIRLQKGGFVMVGFIQHTFVKVCTTTAVVRVRRNISYNIYILE